MCDRVSVQARHRASRACLLPAARCRQTCPSPRVRCAHGLPRLRVLRERPSLCSVPTHACPRVGTPGGERDRSAGLRPRRSGAGAGASAEVLGTRRCRRTAREGDGGAAAERRGRAGAGSAGDGPALVIRSRSRPRIGASRGTSGGSAGGRCSFRCGVGATSGGGSGAQAGGSQLLSDRIGAGRCGADRRCRDQRRHAVPGGRRLGGEKGDHGHGGPSTLIRSGPCRYHVGSPTGGTRSREAWVPPPTAPHPTPVHIRSAAPGRPR